MVPRHRHFPLAGNQARGKLRHEMAPTYQRFRLIRKASDRAIAIYAIEELVAPPVAPAEAGVQYPKWIAGIAGIAAFAGKVASAAAPVTPGDDSGGSDLTRVRLP